MRKILGWTLTVIGLAALVFIAYVTKLNHDLGVSLHGEISRRFAKAGAQVQVLDVATSLPPALNEHDRAVIGQAAAAEFLMSFQIVSYYIEHGTVPTSTAEITSSNPGRQSLLLDSWGNPFRIVPEGTDRYLIVSGGPSGTSSLTAEEKDALENYTFGKSYQLHGKIIFIGGLPPR
jgi:hypothetical protein